MLVSTQSVAMLKVNCHEKTHIQGPGARAKTIHETVKPSFNTYTNSVLRNHKPDHMPPEAVQDKPAPKPRPQQKIMQPKTPPMQPKTPPQPPPVKSDAVKSETGLFMQLR